MLPILLEDVRAYWKTFVLIFTPIILLALPVHIRTPEANCAYVVILMAVYWMTEVAPLPVTALLPIILFPLLGIASTKTVCAEYLKDTNFIFVGGLIMAVALEESNLHKRIALRVLLWMGDEPRWLMMGFMATTAFLSMWMSNTATAAMMLPIAIVVLEELIRHTLPQQEKTSFPLLSAVEAGKMSRKGSQQRDRHFSVGMEDGEEYEHLTVSGHEARRLASSAFIAERQWLKMDVSCQTMPETEVAAISSVPSGPVLPLNPQDGTRHKIPEFHHLPDQLQGICKATLLCIAFGANLGGTGTLTGTGPNLIFVGQLNRFYQNQTAITYASWLIFGAPFMVLGCVLGWAWLVVYFTGWRSLFGGCFQRKKRKNNDVHKALRRKYNELGSISFAEWAITFWLIVLVLLWVLREPLFIAGWDKWLHLKSGYSSDACAGILVAFILFVFPNERPDFLCLRGEKRKRPRLRRGLISWSSMQAKFPWGVIILLGGGFALAIGVQKSGLSSWIGCTLRGSLGKMPLSVVAFSFIALAMFVTCVASNSATASIFIPVAFSVADSIGANPLYLGLPTTLAASCAFMLPVATPPNAIVYESQMIRVTDMIVAGFVMNILCICTILLNIQTWSFAAFDLGKTPIWANTTLTNLNTTSCFR